MRLPASLVLVLLLSVSAHATLVAIVPWRDGLVIAADSRLTFFGAQCDGAFKILVPERPARTVAVVTGDSVFVAPPPAGTADLCGYLASAPRLLDVEAVVTGVLERGGDDPARKLSAACVRAVERFRARYPAALRGYTGREIFSVAVASHDPGAGAATVRSFVVRVRNGRVEAARVVETRIDGRSSRGVWIYGETDWVNRVVYAGAGRRFLDAGRSVSWRGRAGRRGADGAGRDDGAECN